MSRQAQYGTVEQMAMESAATGMSKAYRAWQAMEARKAMQAMKETATTQTHYATSWLGLHYAWTASQAVARDGWIEVTWEGKKR